MNDLLSAINQILDGLGFSASVGQFILDAISFLMQDLPAFFQKIFGSLA